MNKQKIHLQHIKNRMQNNEIELLQLKSHLRDFKYLIETPEESIAPHKDAIVSPHALIDTPAACIDSFFALRDCNACNLLS